MYESDQTATVEIKPSSDRLGCFKTDKEDNYDFVTKRVSRFPENYLCGCCLARRVDRFCFLKESPAH